MSRHDVSGPRVGSGEPFDGVWMRLTATEPGTCRITAAPAAVQAGLCDKAIPVRSPALADTAESGSVAYLTLRRADDGARRWEGHAIRQFHGPPRRPCQMLLMRERSIPLGRCTPPRANQASHRARGRRLSA